MNFNKYIVPLVISLILPAFVVAQMPDDYLKEAAQNNPGLKAKYAVFEAALQKVTQVSALPDPTISFGYFLAPVETRVGAQRAKFNLSQMFPWFGTLAASKDVATLSAEAKYQQFVDAKNELFYTVKSAWYPLYEVEQKVRLQQQNKAILETYKRLSITAFKNDKGTMTDVIRVDIMLADIATEINILAGMKKPLLVHFNKLLNRPDMEEVFLPDSLYVPDFQISYRKESLLASNPILMSYDLGVKSAVAQQKMARKQGLPKFGIGMDYVIVDKRPDVVIQDNGNDIFMPMISISVPIFRGKYKAAVKVAQYTEKALLATKENHINNLTSSYERAIFDLTKAFQLATLDKEQIEKTEQLIHLLFSAYSNSGKDFEEILRMQQQLLKYQMAYVSAVRDYYTAIAHLDYITSKS